MRSFVAIELPDEIKNKLNSLQEQLKSCAADVKWVAAGNIHLTLKFLGEIKEEKQPAIAKILDETVNSKPPFQIEICALGAFPGIDSPRVIWLGIGSGGKETKEIVQELENRFEKIGIPKEGRPFSSHITIGRVRSSLNRQQLVQKLKEAENKIRRVNLKFNAAKITLFKSALTSKGPIYEVLKEASLKTT